MVDILALVPHHVEQAVLTSVELAVADGVPTRTHVLNLLHRLVDGKGVGGPPLDTPQALILRREPKANVERYDGSIRIPASACGVCGFKPSYGRASRRGVLPLSWSLDAPGPLATSLADIEVLLP